MFKLIKIIDDRQTTDETAVPIPTVVSLISHYKYIKVGVSQGSVRVPLFFLIFIND